MIHQQQPVWYDWWNYPLVNIQKAIEHGPFLVDLPIKNGGSFHGGIKTHTNHIITSTQIGSRLPI